MIARLLLPHRAQSVPVYLQMTDRTKATLTLPQKPVEEGVQDINRDVFEGGKRVLVEFAVSTGVD